MPTYTYDHVHLRSKDPMGIAKYFEKMFDASIIETIQSDGQPRIDLDINGLAVFIAKVAQDADMPASPHDPHTGLDHFGFRVDNVDEAVAELKSRGAEIAVEPYTIRPKVRIAFVRAPDDIRIELLQRD